jgi:hypothetical protein
MEDPKPFKIVSVLQDGRSVGITSAYDAAVYILEKWPDDTGDPKLENCKAILLPPDRIVQCRLKHALTMDAQGWTRDDSTNRRSPAEEPEIVQAGIRMPIV